MFFSIILPVYNAEKFLAATLESILTQTYQDFELICVNDRSSDSSLSILSSLQSQYPHKIRIINHSENMGLADARNTGLFSATGDYICFIDNDDLVAKDWLMLSNVLIESNSNPDILSFGISYFDNNDTLNVDKIKNLLFTSSTNSYNEYYLEGLITKKEELKRLIFVTHQYSWSRIYKHSLFKDNNIYFPKGIKNYEDIATTPRLIFFAQSIYVANYYAPIFYRTNINSLSQKTDRALAGGHLNIYSILEFLYNFLEENKAQDLYKKEFNFLVNEYAFWFMINRVSHLKQKDKKRLEVFSRMIVFYATFPLKSSELDTTKIRNYDIRAKKNLLDYLEKASSMNDLEKGSYFLSCKINRWNLFPQERKDLIKNKTFNFLLKPFKLFKSRVDF